MNSVGINRKIDSTITKCEVQERIRHFNSYFNRINSDLEFFITKMELEILKEESRCETSGSSFSQSRISLQEELYMPMFYSSSLVSLFSFLEVSLNQICEFLERNNDGVASFKKQRGNGLNKSQSYLKENFGLRINSLSQQDWMMIKEVNLVRNCIVHAGGNVNYLNNTDKEKIELAVKKTDALDILNSGEVRISKSYIRKAHFSIEKLLSEVVSKTVVPV